MGIAMVGLVWLIVIVSFTALVMVISLVFFAKPHKKPKYKDSIADDFHPILKAVKESKNERSRTSTGTVVDTRQGGVE